MSHYDEDDDGNDERDEGGADHQADTCHRAGTKMIMVITMY